MASTSSAPKNQVSVKFARPWSATQASFARTLGERAMAQSILHLDAHRRLWWINICFVLPTIVLSLLGGACNSSQSSLVALWPEDNQENIAKILPLILGLVGLLVSVLNSIQSYLGTARLVEAHYIAHTGFSKLQRLIASEVSLPQQERGVSGTEAIAAWRVQYDQLLENSPSISVKLEKRFSKRKDVRKAGIVVPPNIKVKGIQTYEEVMAAMERGENKKTETRRPGLRRAASRVFGGGGGGREEKDNKQKKGSSVFPVPPDPKVLAIAGPPPPIVPHVTFNQNEKNKRPPHGKGSLKKQRKATQKELQSLQNMTSGRVASIANLGLRPTSSESDDDDDSSSEDDNVANEPGEVIEAIFAARRGSGAAADTESTEGSKASSSSDASLVSDD